MSTHVFTHVNVSERESKLRGTREKRSKPSKQAAGALEFFFVHAGGRPTFDWYHLKIDQYHYFQ
jgi:hypothetical protein